MELPNLNEDFALFGYTYRLDPISEWRWEAIDFETFIFSGGEVHVKIKAQPPKRVRINCRINNSNDLMRLILAVDALRSMGVEYIEAFMPYIPYARQDRRMVGGEPLSIKVFAGIINSIKLDKIKVYDSHSDVALALIDNVINYPNFKEVSKFIELCALHLKDYTVVSPDLGAYKKVSKMCEYLGYKNQIVAATKIRDLNTGKIIATELYGDVKGKNCLIVDDICDGGRTFTELAATLKDKGANDLYLFVSHGIFSKGYSELMLHYKEIGTTNSFSKEYPRVVSSESVKRIEVINLEY